MSAMGAVCSSALSWSPEVIVPVTPSPSTMTCTGSIVPVSSGSPMMSGVSSAGPVNGAACPMWLAFPAPLWNHDSRRTSRSDMSARGPRTGL